MEKRALGKGLSALIPQQTQDSDQEQAVHITNVPTALVRNNTQQPRTHYDEVKQEELKSSIREKGVLQPILVRALGDEYEVVAGERRLRAARDLGLDEVPAIIKDLTDKEALVIALIENIQREELNPIEEAQAYRRLAEDFGFTQEQIAASVGKDRTTITNSLRILNLPDYVQEKVYNGEISVGHARTLLSIASQNEMNRLLEKIIKNAWSVRELENKVRGLTQEGGSRRAKKEKEKNIEIIALEEELQKILGTKVRIQASKKRGKIIIEYYSHEDLDRVIEKIKK